MAHLWMVRAGGDNEIIDLVESKNAVAIGWSQMGDLSTLRTRQQFKDRYNDCFPEEKNQSRINLHTGQIYRFAREIKTDDYVLTYNQSSRKILIGKVIGGYRYSPQEIHENYPHVRQVEWLQSVSRDQFSEMARNSLGSSLRVFKMDEHLREVLTLLQGRQEIVEEELNPPFYEEVKSKADELISDKVSHLGPYEMQDLVAAVLQAIGYRAVSVKPGPDLGIDIEASPDPLGFEEPRIMVQVKHRTDKVIADEMRSFIGALHKGEHGMYVSSGGFTKDAVKEARMCSKNIRMIDREQFIGLLLEYYDHLEPEYKTLIPLRRIWVPVDQ